MSDFDDGHLIISALADYGHELIRYSARDGEDLLVRGRAMQALSARLAAGGVPAMAAVRRLEGAERRAEQATRDHGRMAAELERVKGELAAAQEALRALEARVKRNARGKR